MLNENCSSDGTGVDVVSKPISVNFTVTTRCNYNCKYCFAQFPELADIPPPTFEEMKITIAFLVEAGCEKLTFVGGEPLLCPQLPNLLALAHNLGVTTMIVTNGTLLTRKFLREIARHTDWISLSVDSQHEEVQSRLGRGAGGHVEQTLRCARLVREQGIRLKLNTVVTRYNCNEDMNDFIVAIGPERWKVFQFLPIEGQNDKSTEELRITATEFRGFSERHSDLSYAVFEDNDDMTGSYMMISPQGRFFNNASGRHEYTDSVLENGVSAALAQNKWNIEKFVERGGIYEWAKGNDTLHKPITQEVIPRERNLASLP